MLAFAVPPHCLITLYFLYCWQQTSASQLLFALQVKRHESCSIVLHGQSEFEASHVTLSGEQLFEVPNGYKMIVTAGPCGTISRSLELLQEEPSWQWKYTMDAKQNVQLSMETASTTHVMQPKYDAADLSYII